MIDPDRAHIWGMKKGIIDAIIAAEMFMEDRIAAGNTDGISLKDQLDHKFEHLDVSEQNRLEEFKKELRQGQEQ